MDESRIDRVGRRRGTERKRVSDIFLKFWGLPENTKIGKSGAWQGMDFNHVTDLGFGFELVDLLREELGRCPQQVLSKAIQIHTGC